MQSIYYYNINNNYCKYTYISVAKTKTENSFLVDVCHSIFPFKPIKRGINNRVVQKKNLYPVKKNPYGN